MFCTGSIASLALAWRSAAAVRREYRFVIHAGLREYGGHLAWETRCPPDQPPCLVARNRFRANNDPGPDVLSSHLRRWISRVIASWMLNGDSEDEAKELPVVCKLRQRPRRGVVAIQSPASPVANLPAGRLFGMRRR